MAVTLTRLCMCHKCRRLSCRSLWRLGRPPIPRHKSPRSHVWRTICRRLTVAPLSSTLSPTPCPAPTALLGLAHFCLMHAVCTNANDIRMKSLPPASRHLVITMPSLFPLSWSAYFITKFLLLWESRRASTLSSCCAVWMSVSSWVQGSARPMTGAQGPSMQNTASCTSPT